jgi:hypothetical protein
VFESQKGYKLYVLGLEMRSRIGLAPAGARDHTGRLDAFLVAPKEEDAVGVTQKLKVLRIADAQDRSLVKPKPPSRYGGSGTGKQPSRYQAKGYTYLHDRIAQVEVPLTELRKNGYTMNEMTLGAISVIAEERKDKDVRAIVMEEPVAVVSGLKVRVTNLQMSRSRELSVTVKCERPKGGAYGPFLERITVLDEESKPLASARPSQGDAWAKTSTLTAKLPFPRGKTHKFLRFTACTKFHKTSMTFKVEGIFQK